MSSMKFAAVVLLALATGASARRSTAGTSARRLVTNTKPNLDAVSVEVVKEDELRRRSSRPLSLAEAERALSQEIERVYGQGSLLQDKSSSAGKNRGSAGKGSSEPGKASNESNATGEEFDRFVEALNASEAKYREDQLANAIHSSAPKVHGSVCLQLDIDLAWLGVPGFTVNLGLLGGVHFNGDGCWDLLFEASIGFQFGVKILGYGLKIGVALTGDLQLTEVPPLQAMVIDDSNTSNASDTVYAAEGADLSRCQSHSAWVLIETFLEHEAAAILSMREVEEATKQAAQNATILAEEEECRREYEELLNGSWRVLEEDAVHAPRLTSTAAAMAQALRIFVGHLPAYAGQVMELLVDSSTDTHDSDWSWSNVIFGDAGLTRLAASTGRYWARWPTSERFKKLCKGEKCEEKYEGMMSSGTDQRVLNFAKAMRLSDGRRGLHFWKEMTISAANLLVRTVGDVKALFSAAFAEDAEWDGSCDSLKSSFLLGKDISPEVVHDHAWASGHYEQEEREAFMAHTTDSEGRPHSRVFNGTAFEDSANDGLARKLYPRLWCTLLQHAPGGGNKPDEEFWVQSTCENVDTDSSDLQDNDTIQWNATQGVYQVTRDGAPAGFLALQEGALAVCRHCLEDLGLPANLTTGRWPQDAIAAAREKWVKATLKVLESRAECEQAVLPGSFVRLFPSFVERARKHKQELQVILRDINLCMGEVMTTGRALKTHWNFKSAGCGKTFEEKRDFVTRQGQKAVRSVRRWLLSIGAEDPRRLPGFEDGAVPLDKDERYIAEDSPKRFALLGRMMASDFKASFGAGPSALEDEEDQETPEASIASPVEASAATTYESEASPDADAASKPEFLVLEGALWRHLPRLRNWLLKFDEPLQRMGQLHRYKIRPPLMYSEGFVFTTQPDGNGFCTPNTALMIFQEFVRTSGKTWSTDTSTEHCRVGRLRPGDVFVQVMRCDASDTQDGKEYVDWKVRMQMVTRPAIPDLTSLSSLATSAPALGALLGKAGLFLAGGVATVAAGAAASVQVVDRLAHFVHEHPIAKTLLFLSGTAGPLFGAVAASTATAASTAGEVTFRKICKTFVERLQMKGVVPTPDIGGPAALGFGIKNAIVIWGAINYREKKVDLLNAQGEPSGETAVKYQRMSSLHLESWNRAEVTLPIPTIGQTSLYGKLDLDWDLTDWMEFVTNRRSFEQNRQRQELCASCLRDGMSFCDWRYSMGSLWEPGLDTCRNASRAAADACRMDMGFTDDFGHPLKAAYFAPEHGIESCGLIDFQRTNEELKLTERLRNFLDRY